MELTQARLHELFEYREDGALVWKVQKAQRTQVGSVAGWQNQDVHGQRYMNVEVDGRAHKLHRLVFLWHHGYLPSRIDHIDGNRLNNCIENLRPATASQNAMNGKHRVNNTSGAKNVTHDKRSNKWRVLLQVCGKPKSLGYFDDFELADLVATEARHKFHGQFARHY
jgi:hypothetical protein